MPGVAESVPHLRRWVRLPLAGDADMADAFELIISEYGTNALRHSASGAPGGRIKAELSVAVEHVCLAVLDGGGPVKNGAPADDELAEHGRGLVLACAYADEAGRFDTLDGRTSWALIKR
ncbi:ATP-binding protein [Spirillospora sp. NPDC052242]